MSSDSPLSDGSQCGAELMEAFMRDPTAELDLECVDQTLPLDFDPSAAYADYWFGTEGYWD